jgi:hypothetical protein
MSAASTPDYDAIAPLIADAKDEASGVLVRFRCPTTGTEVTSDGAWPDDGLVERTAGQVKRGLLSTVRNSLALTVRRAVGSDNPIAQVGADASSQVIYGVGNEHAERRRRSDGDRRTAICTAFKTVAHRFVWDEKTDRFVAATAPSVQRSDFDALVSDHPLTTDYDRDVLSRLLAALAPGAATQAPGRVDFEETSPGLTRETMLLVAWGMALTDDHLSAGEQATLDAAAAALGVAAERAAALATMARSHIIDQAIAELVAQGVERESVRAQVEALGEQIGLGRDEAARAFIRWTKREA